MKTNQIAVWTILSLALFVGCQSDKKSDQKVLSVTIEPQRFFLEKIVGNSYRINTVVPPGASPETYEPTPAMMLDLAESEMYFKVGYLGFENAWTADLAKNNPKMTIVDCSRGIDLMMGEHDHGSDEKDIHRSPAPDPHVWSSPKTAKIFAGNMYRALVFAHPDSTRFYKTNFEKLEKIIDETDSIVSGLLRTAPSRSFIIYHPALSYLARDYDLIQHSIEFEGKNPSPSQMKSLVDVAKSEQVKVVFIQKGFDRKNAEVVAREVGAKVFEINPLGYEWDKETIRIAEILAGKKDE